MKLLVSKDRSKLPRAGSALKVSTRANSKTSPLGKPEEPGALAWCGVSGRAPAGTTWARSEAESGRAVAAVPPELAVGPGRSAASRACRAGAGARLANPDPTRCLAAERLRLSHPPNWPQALALRGEAEKQTARPPRIPDCPINKVWSKLPLPGKRRVRKLSC